MLHMEQPDQGIYTPLNQMMSDSESEEEIHNTSKHRQQRLQEQGHIQLKRQSEQLQQHRRKLKYQQPDQRDQHYPRRHQQQLELINHNISRTQSSPSTHPMASSRRQIITGNKQLCQNELIHLQHEQLQQQQKMSLNHLLSNSHCQPSSYTTNMQNTFRSVMMSDIGLNVEAGHCDAVNSNFSNLNNEYDERNNIDADDVAILSEACRSSKAVQHQPMSSRRRCCFIGSLLLCAFAVIAFVWWIPCHEDNTCPATIDRVKTRNWLNNYTKIELKGGAHIVSGKRSWENNLIFLYRGDVFFGNLKSRNSKPNGIISLIGNSGAVAWYVEMTDEPVAIDCTLIDIKLAGSTDCLVIDDHGELGALNPITGQWYWHYKERSSRKVDASDFPIILPDLNDDGVFEILLVTSASLEQRTKNFVRNGDIKLMKSTQQHESVHSSDRNILRLISGQSGGQIGEGYHVTDCDVLRNLQLEGSYTITYSCLRNKKEAQRSKTLAELFALITNKSVMVSQKLVKNTPSIIAQHRYHDQRKGIDAQRNVYSLSGRELIIENRGKCPENCEVTLILSEERNGHTVILRNFTNSGMYGMVPVQWHFKNTKSKLSGFVMKFWKWDKLNNAMQSKAHGPNKPPLSTSAVPSTPKAKVKSKSNSTKDASTLENKAISHQSNRTIKNRHRRHDHLNHEFPTNEFNIFDNFIHKRNSYTIPDNRRHIVRRQTSMNTSINNDNRNNEYIHNNSSKERASINQLADSYKMQIITETVVLVIFIGADTRIENTSQSNIVQFCRNDGTETTCQPDIHNQGNSMLIADLDQDGSQELVSYMSKFVCEDDSNRNWKLITYVRLLRLQLELPSFYENVENRY